MEELLKKIEESCNRYLNEEVDDAGFRQVINEIPAELWKDKDFALSILRGLAENEDLYEVSLKQRRIFAEFLCAQLPEIFWESKEVVLAATEMIMKILSIICEYLDYDNVEAIFSYIPKTMWEDDVFARNMTDLVCSWARAIEYFDNITDLLPKKTMQTENDLRYVIVTLFNEDERNAGDLNFYPRKAWEFPELIYLMFSCLEEALEIDRGWDTMYPNFQGSDEDYMEEFLSYVPEKFKSDKKFILGFLEYNYFCDAFCVVYDWIDKELWKDKEFVIAVLENDSDALEYVSEELMSDEEFKKFIEENF